MLDKKAQITLILRRKFVRNSATVNVTNISLETVIFSPNEMLVISDLRSIGCCRIKHILQQNHYKYF